MIGKIEKINRKTDVKGKDYETILVKGEWLINRDDETREIFRLGKLKEGQEYDFAVVQDGRWTTITDFVPVIDESQPEPEEPSFDEPQIGQKSEPCSRDESIVRQVAYKVASEAIKSVSWAKSPNEDDVMKTLQDFAHVVAVDVLYGVNWDK